jgi:hypothetical protein
MTNLRNSLFVPILLSLFPFGSAFAQVATTYVDPLSGLDTNTSSNCSISAPCQSIVAALTVTASPGTVLVTRDGNFAPITISGGQTIACPGIACIINSSGGATAVTVSAGANDTVGLNGVSISGYGTGGTGILVTSVGKIELRGTSVSGNAVGINFSPTSGSSHLYLLDSEVRFSSAQNVEIAPTGSASAQAVFTHSRVHHGASGFKADASGTTGSVSVTLSDSVLSFHSNNGVTSVGGTGSVRLILDRVTITNTGINGVTSNGATSSVFMTKSVVTQNAVGLNSVNGGFIFSAGDNAVAFNSSNGTAPSSPTMFH